MNRDVVSQQEQGTDSLLRFAVLPYQFCLPAVQVVGIIVPPRMTVLPMSGADVAGVFMYQGELATCIDLRHKFSLSPRQDKTSGQLLLGRAGQTLLAFWVDEVSDIVNSNSMSWRELPALQSHGQVFTGCYLSDQDIILETSIEQMFNSDRVAVSACLQALVREQMSQPHKQSQPRTPQADAAVVVPVIPAINTDTQSAASVADELSDSSPQAVTPATIPEPAADTAAVSGDDVGEQYAPAMAALAHEDITADAGTMDAVAAAPVDDYPASSPAANTAPAADAAGGNASASLASEGQPDAVDAQGALAESAVAREVMSDASVDAVAESATDDSAVDGPVQTQAAEPESIVSEPTDTSAVDEPAATEALEAMSTASGNVDPSQTAHASSAEPVTEEASTAAITSNQAQDDVPALVPDSSPAAFDLVGDNNTVNTASAGPGRDVTEDADGPVKTAVAETGAPETGATETALPDTGLPETGLSEFNTQVSEPVVIRVTAPADFVDASVQEAAATTTAPAAGSAAGGSKLPWLLAGMGGLGLLLIAYWLWTATADERQLTPRVSPVAPVSTVAAPPRTSQRQLREVLRIEDENLLLRVERDTSVTAAPEMSVVAPAAVERRESDGGVGDNLGAGQRQPSPVPNQAEQQHDESQSMTAVVPAATPQPAAIPAATAPSASVEVNGEPSLSSVVSGDGVNLTIVRHIVVRGDTLWHIAKRYLGNPYRYPQLAQLSQIKNPDLIYPGDIVTIEYSE